MGFSIPQALSHCRLSMSADQLNPVASDVVSFDTQDAAGGDLVRSGNTIDGLKAGRIYLILCNIHIGGATGYTQFRLYDVTAASVVEKWLVRTPPYSTSAAEGSMLIYAYAPPSNTSIRIEVAGITAGMDLLTNTNGKSYFSAIDLGAVA